MRKVRWVFAHKILLDVYMFAPGLTVNQVLFLCRRVAWAYGRVGEGESVDKHENESVKGSIARSTLPILRSD